MILYFLISVSMTVYEKANVFDNKRFLVTYGSSLLVPHSINERRT